MSVVHIILWLQLSVTSTHYTVATVEGCTFYTVATVEGCTLYTVATVEGCTHFTVATVDGCTHYTREHFVQYRVANRDASYGDR